MSKRAILRHQLLIACVLLTLSSGAAIAQKFKAPASEVLLLPKFCWSQYAVDAKGPQYSISKRLCGVGMNHYCEALLELNRGMKSNGIKRGRHLKGAKAGIEYTLRWMAPYPNCPIRAHVETSLRMVDSMLRSDSYH